MSLGPERAAARFLEGGTVLAVDFIRIFWPKVLYPKQIAFVLGSHRRYQLFLGGRGCGKTWALMLKALYLAIINPGCNGAVLGRTLTKDVAAKLFPEFMRHCARFKRSTGVDLIDSHDTTNWITTLRNGSRIYWLAYGRIDQLEQNRGYDLAWAVLDEIESAQVDPQYAWDVIDDAVRQPDAQHFQLCFGTTPNGLRGAVARFVRAQANESPDHYVVHATSYDNPHLDPKEIAKRERGRSKRMADQEIKAVVLRPASVVFAELKKLKHIRPFLLDMSGRWVVGIDWGTTKGHMVAIHVSPSGRWTVFAERRTDELSRPGFRAVVQEFISECWALMGKPPSMIGADRAVTEENSWLRGRFAKHCEFGVKTCESTNDQLVLRGVGYIQYMLDPADGSAHRLSFSDQLSQSLDAESRCIIGSMMNYRYREEMRDGVAIVTNSPLKDGINDDPVDSLRYPIVTSRMIPELHGGEVLPCIRADSYSKAA